MNIMFRRGNIKSIGAKQNKGFSLKVINRCNALHKAKG